MGIRRGNRKTHAKAPKGANRGKLRLPRQGGYALQVLLLTCPRCRASAGDRCVKLPDRRYSDYGIRDEGGEALPDPHVERVELARKSA